jgi:hypothetical protein
MIQAIPTYSMSVFLLPKTSCSEINSLMQRFWWGHQKNEAKIPWMSWRQMGKSKFMRGMGFRDFYNFNKALLAKQFWRLWFHSDSLIASIMKAKYYSESSILEASVGHCPSFAWRSIHSSSAIVKEGLVWQVGNGSSVRIWKDRWFPQQPMFRILSPSMVLNPDAKVCDLIDANTKWWNNQLLDLLFTKEEKKMIQSISINSTNRSDAIIWRGTANGIFSVRSAYYIQQGLKAQTMAGTSNPEGKREVWRKLWALPVSNVEKHFLWRACNDSLLTRENLARRKVITDSICPFCEQEVETCSHILWLCPLARDVWSMGPLKIQKSSLTGPDFMQIIESIFYVCSEEETIQFVGLVHRIWLKRNEVLHGGIFTHPRELVLQALRVVEEYKQA